MNKVDIVRKHIGNDDFYDINGTSMLTNILNAMEEYKEQEVKNCSIPAVINSVCDCGHPHHQTDKNGREYCRYCEKDWNEQNDL